MSVERLDPFCTDGYESEDVVYRHPNVPAIQDLVWERCCGYCGMPWDDVHPETEEGGSTLQCGNCGAEHDLSE